MTDQPITESVIRAIGNVITVLEGAAGESRVKFQRCGMKGECFNYFCGALCLVPLWRSTAYNSSAHLSFRLRAYVYHNDDLSRSHRPSHNTLIFTIAAFWRAAPLCLLSRIEAWCRLHGRTTKSAGIVSRLSDIGVETE